MNNFSIVVSAPSGAGKTTIIDKLLQLDLRFCFSISTTTRPMRKGEQNGRDYYFISVPEFQDLIAQNGLIEWNTVHGNLYGITKKEIDRIVAMGKIPIFDVDVKGAAVLRKVLEDAVFVFIIPPSRKELERRLRNRNTDSEEQIKIRLANSIEEICQYNYYDYIIINDHIDTAVDQLRSIATAEYCKKQRNTNTIQSILEDMNDYTA